MASKTNKNFHIFVSPQEMFISVLPDVMALLSLQETISTIVCQYYVTDKLLRDLDLQLFRL